MRHEETRDNTTAIENQSIEADAHADTHVDPRVGIEGSDPTGRETFGERMLRLGESEPDPAGVQLERRFGELPEDATKRIAREHDKIVAEARRDSEERNGCDDEPEDDGQPSEYEEWQDYFGGDEYYDHSENECW